MSVEKFNSFFNRFGRFQIKYRFFFLLALALVTAAGIFGLTKFQADTSEDGWFDNSEEVKRNQDYFESIFGSDDSIMVLVESENVFDPRVLDAIQRLGNRLEKEVPHPLPAFQFQGEMKKDLKSSILLKVFQTLQVKKAGRLLKTGKTLSFPALLW